MYVVLAPASPTAIVSGSPDTDMFIISNSKIWFRTGTTSLDNTAAINARLAEIGDTYKDLGPYDTWKPITGLDYASYNPTTGKADYTENGVKIVLPKGTN